MESEKRELVEPQGWTLSKEQGEVGWGLVVGNLEGQTKASREDPVTDGAPRRV